VIGSTGRRARRGGAIALCAVAAALTARAEEQFPLRGLGRPSFLVDASVESVAEDSVDVELTWQVPARDLSFHPEDDVQRARYEIAVVFAQDGRQVEARLWERRVRVRTVAETRDPQRASKGRQTVRLREGRYDLRVTVTDRISGATTTGDASLDARRRGAGIGLSDLRLVRYTEGGVQSNPSHEVRLGEAGHFLRASVRPAKSGGGTVRLHWRVADPGGGTASEGDTTLTLGSEPLVVDLPVPEDRLSPGSHDVEVRLVGTGGERRHLTLDARLTPAWFTRHRAETLEILTLRTSEEEVSALKSAPADGWAEALAVFWKDRDPTLGTEENEFLRDVEERVETASSLFMEPFRFPGWRTDRGHAWIHYGPPDRRTTSVGDFDQPGREVWEYDSPQRVLVFVDRGSGEYWLSG
jgi:GWxTD domain-containing protein